MGPVRSTHPVATGRRRVLGRVSLIVALVSALLLALMFVIDLGGAQYALIFAAFPFLLAAPASVVLLRKARTPEVIELYGVAVVLGKKRADMPDLQ
jgi:hypothetical protein